jgi:DNA processing protein
MNSIISVIFAVFCFVEYNNYMKNNNQHLYYLAFSYFPDIGPMRFRQLVDYFGDVQKAYLAPEKELKELLGPKLLRNFIDFRNKFNPAETYRQITKKQIFVIPIDSNQYPAQLAAISDPPIVLYLKGDPEIFAKYKDNFFAIVGSRKTSYYGQQIAGQIAYDLSNNNLIIVSGMATGIDSFSHWGALRAGKPTVAVLGCGVDIIYPPENKQLYDKIINSSGAVVSEFSPGHSVLKGLFVSRNRIISGLSKGVLVVEGAEYSGALITARYAAEQGRDVFAPPSPITSQFSKAPNLLIKQGAKLITEAGDILEEYHLNYHQKTNINIDNLPEYEREIASSLLCQPLTVDELAAKLHLSINQLLQSLTILELKKIASKNDDGKYYIMT